MSVSRESILAALEDMIQLEELSTSNLTEVNRCDFSCFGAEGADKVKHLLLELREDVGAHTCRIHSIMEKLRNGGSDC